MGVVRTPETVWANVGVLTPSVPDTIRLEYLVIEFVTDHVFINGEDRNYIQDVHISPNELSWLWP